MDIVNNQNPNKVHYFDIHDYVDEIRVDKDILEHMEETNKEFDGYMNQLSSYKYDNVVHLWLIQTAEELASSSKIEKHNLNKQEILKNDLFFETLTVNHQRIHKLHNFVMGGKEPKFEYRKDPVRVSYYDQEGIEHIYWHGPEPEDVFQFMNDFISFYKSTDLSVINSNPFLKSALIQLLFIRIHPYNDGNGRTSRLLYSIKFTEAVNKLYGTKLKLCPLNISASILMNQITYVNILDNIYFDLEHDNNKYINKWFNFILNMADEQLFYLQNKLGDLEEAYNYYSSDDIRFQRMLEKILYDIKDLNNKELEEYKQKRLGTQS